MHRLATRLLAATCFFTLSPVAFAQSVHEDSGVLGPMFQEGDVISYERLEALRPFIPPEFWANRDFFFFEGMRLEVGPFFRDYSPAAEYEAATRRFAGQPQVGPDENLENYVAGQPFPMDEIDCENDPQAAAKIMWIFDYQWQGDGGAATYLYTYWDRGEELPLFYEGTAKYVILSARVEKEYLDKYNGDLFRGETRKSAFGIEVEAPFDARGIKLMTYRYKDSDKPRSQSKNDDTWVYLPQLRRVRRISLAQRADAVSGTDFTFDDLNSFAGIVPQYEWTCLGEMDIIAPMNSQIRGFPYSRDNNFGPYGLSYANDRWELRHAVKVRMTPKDADYPYSRKDLYLDKETLTALYSFAYDQQGELWKIIWHNHRWSEDDREWYKGWEAVPNPRDLRIVSDTIANVQTGTGNRIEFWNNHGTPYRSRGRVRRYIDIGRLTKGRGSTKRFFVR
jgi:hypothetical protein